MSKEYQGVRTGGTLVAMTFAVLLLSSFCTGIAAAKTVRADQIERTPKAMAFRDAMRRLWEDHVFYTRMVIISIDGNLKDLDATSDRLLHNQVDIGDAVKPFYGDAAGSKLTALLQEHIKVAGELLVAAKAGDEAKAKDAKSRWYANADVIAAFLTGANPVNWPTGDTRMLMRMHLDTTMDEATARFSGNWKADIAAFDKVNDHILNMADVLSLGIIRQFPDKFK